MMFVFCQKQESMWPCWSQSLNWCLEVPVVTRGQFRGPGSGRPTGTMSLSTLMWLGGWCCLLELTFTDCSVGESNLCFVSGQHTRADPVVFDAGEPSLREWENKSWPLFLPCNGIGKGRMHPHCYLWQGRALALGSRVRELGLPYTSCSTQESRPFTRPGLPLLSGSQVSQLWGAAEPTLPSYAP